MPERRSARLRRTEKALSSLPADDLDSREATSIRYIDGSLMKEILHGKYDLVYSRKFIIDCRFAYEYAGGHIQNAENHWTSNMIDALLFRDLPPDKGALIVLHCEYSECRAPHMADYIRRQDRQYNEERYPCLTYPTIWILEGGYRSFYNSHKSLCEPQGYTSERDVNEPNSSRSAIPKGPRKRYKNVRVRRRKCNLMDKLRDAQDGERLATASTTCSVSDKG
ncbi:hypothetical protein HBI08_238600 [Parastagonospora nodorum]|nr:hypothetical protein HBI08_238600 [Parastagonospora nodorum]